MKLNVKPVIIWCTICAVQIHLTLSCCSGLGYFRGTSKPFKTQIRILFEHQRSTDVTFVIRDKADNSDYTVGAHKVILMLASPYLWSTIGSRSFNQTIVEKEVHRDVMMQVLRFVYGMEMSISEDNVMKVLYASRKYRIKELIKRCLMFIYQRIGRDNVLDFLAKGLKANENSVVERCKSVIAKRTLYVLKSAQFNEITYGILSYILEFPVLAAPETEIIKATFGWAENKLTQTRAANIRRKQRTLLGDVFYMLRFPTLSMEQFSQIVCPSGLLSDTEELQLFRYISSTEQQRNSMKIPYPTITRVMYKDLSQALILTTHPCGNKHPQLDVHKIAAQTYQADFDLENENVPVVLQGLRLAVPFVINGQQVSSVPGLTVRFKRRDKGCERKRRRKRVYRNGYYREEYVYETVCSTIYPDIFKTSIKEEDIDLDVDDYPFTDILWANENAFNLSNSLSFTVQYNFTVSSSETNQNIGWINTDFHVKSVDEFNSILATAGSPIRGFFYPRRNNENEADYIAELRMLSDEIGSGVEDFYWH